MPIDKDPEFFKLLVGFAGTLSLGVGTLFVKLFFNLKKTIDIVFGRLNRTDHRVTEVETRLEEREKMCEERHGRK